jgi:hypothetical protein
VDRVGDHPREIGGLGQLVDWPNQRGDCRDERFAIELVGRLDQLVERDGERGALQERGVIRRAERHAVTKASGQARAQAIELGAFREALKRLEAELCSDAERRAGGVKWHSAMLAVSSDAYRRETRFPPLLRPDGTRRSRP